MGFKWSVFRRPKRFPNIPSTDNTASMTSETTNMNVRSFATNYPVFLLVVGLQMKQFYLGYLFAAECSVISLQTAQLGCLNETLGRLPEVVNWTRNFLRFRLQKSASHQITHVRDGTVGQQTVDVISPDQHVLKIIKIMMQLCIKMTSLFCTKRFWSLPPLIRFIRVSVSGKHNSFLLAT